MGELIVKLLILDIEGTHEKIVLNGKSEAEIQKALCNLEEVLANVELGVEDTIKKIGNSYVTSLDNSNWYKELYGWEFSEVSIASL
jgi:enamine deaminase RidA (YjgF/YER057c/UK114 family)